MSAVLQHTQVPIGERDLAWIKSALQIAIELEHSTIPLYLSGMFSLETQNYTSYNLIRSIAMEEMVHMAIACNTLAAIGGTPRLHDLVPGFPRKGLPGDAEPDLDAVLAQLSKPQLKNYLRVEMPEFLVPAAFKHEEYPTIAALYNALTEAIERNADEVRAAIKAGGTSNQVGDDIGFTTITYVEGEDPLTQVYAGFEEILEQGEGATSRSLHAGPGSQDEPSHYCRFAEIHYGHRYQDPPGDPELTRETEALFFKGYVVPFPSVVNTLMIPPDAYEAVLRLDPKGAEVETHLLAFDQCYTDIMTQLEAMWNGPKDKSWPSFGAAVAKMADMRVLSCFYIMQNEIPADVVARLAELYPEEYGRMERYTRLGEPVYYGPRFLNLNAQSAPALA